jgi:predicted Zn-dependent peptidase
VHGVATHLYQDGTGKSQAERELALVRQQIDQLNSALHSEKRRAQRAEMEANHLRQQLATRSSLLAQYQSHLDNAQAQLRDRAELARGIEKLVQIRLEDLLALAGRLEDALLGHQDIRRTLEALRNEAYILTKVAILKHNGELKRATSLNPS